MAIYRPKGMSKLLERDSSTPDLIIKETGEIYTGQFYHYDIHTGVYFTGKPSDPDASKRQLIDAPSELAEGSGGLPFVPKNEYDKLVKDGIGYSLRVTNTLPTYNGEPTQLDRQVGFYNRYFAQHKYDGYVVEIDRTTYRLLKQKSNEYHYPSFFIGTISWILRGPVADQEINGYIVYGTAERNQIAIDRSQKQLPNIRTYLTDPTQFVE